MHVTIHTTVVERTSCLTCNEDEEASPGAPCTCAERDVELTVVGDVSESAIGPHFEILSIKEDGHAWSPKEIGWLEFNDRIQIEEALWSRYAETEPRKVLERDVAELAESIKGYVSVALESGTAPERVRRMLAGARHAVFGFRDEGGFLELSRPSPSESAPTLRLLSSKADE